MTKQNRHVEALFPAHPDAAENAMEKLQCTNTQLDVDSQTEVNDWSQADFMASLHNRGPEGHKESCRCLS